MKNKKIAISKINIQVGDKELSLSLEEVRELRDALNEMFDGKEVTVVPSYPIIIKEPAYPYWYWHIPHITVGNITTGTVWSYSANSGALTFGNDDPAPLPVV